MKTYKTIAATLVFSVLLAFNFCLAECAFASEHHPPAPVKGNAHHHESESQENHSDSGEHDAASLCCSSMVATTNFASHFTNTQLAKEPLFDIPVATVLSASAAQPKYKIEYPPGASPPAVFILTHFTHAPPISL